MNKTYTETFAVRATDCDFERRMRLASSTFAVGSSSSRTRGRSARRAASATRLPSARVMTR